MSRPSRIFLQIGAAASATLSGTAEPTITEADVVTGGKTIILTLSGGETWVAAGSFNDTIKQAIIDGLNGVEV